MDTQLMFTPCRDGCVCALCVHWVCHCYTDKKTTTKTPHLHTYTNTHTKATQTRTCLWPHTQPCHTCRQIITLPSHFAGRHLFSATLRGNTISHPHQLPVRHSSFNHPLPTSIAPHWHYATHRPPPLLFQKQGPARRNEGPVFFAHQCCCVCKCGVGGGGVSCAAGGIEGSSEECSSFSRTCHCNGTTGCFVQAMYKPFVGGWCGGLVCVCIVCTYKGCGS